MKKYLALIPLCFGLSQSIHAQDDILTRKIVVPTPKADEYLVHKDQAYRGDAEAKTLADIYLPPGLSEAVPAVFFIHGGPVPASVPVAAKDWGQYKSYGALMAGAGLAGVTFNYTFASADDFEAAATDVKAVVKFVRANADKYSIDKDRICMWFFSGGGSFVAPTIAERPEWLRCIVVYYSPVGPHMMDALGMKLTDEQRKLIDPRPTINNKSDWDPALFVAEAGADRAELNEGLQLFVKSAVDNKWKVEYWNHPTGPHAFDILQDDERSRAITMRTVDFLQDQLGE